MPGSQMGKADAMRAIQRIVPQMDGRSARYYLARVLCDAANQPGAMRGVPEDIERAFFDGLAAIERAVLAPTDEEHDAALVQAAEYLSDEMLDGLAACNVRSAKSYWLFRTARALANSPADRVQCTVANDLQGMINSGRWSHNTVRDWVALTVLYSDTPTITIKQAMLLYGGTEQRYYGALRRGLLAFEQNEYGEWVARRADVESYLANLHPSGRRSKAYVARALPLSHEDYSRARLERQDELDKERGRITLEARRAAREAAAANAAPKRPRGRPRKADAALAPA